MDKKYYKYVQINCEFCNKKCKVALHKIKSGKGKTCSTACGRILAAKTKMTGDYFDCSHPDCDKKFYKKKSKQKSKSGHYFCSVAHKNECQKIIGGIKEMHPAHYGDVPGDYRKTALGHYPNKCNRCSYDEHPEILMVHHIDRDRKNHRVDNLEVLCPTCHEKEHLLAGDGRWGSY